MTDYFKTLDNFESAKEDGVLAQAIADSLRFWSECIATRREYKQARIYKNLAALLGAVSNMCENDGGEDFSQEIADCIDYDDPLFALCDVIDGYTGDLNEVEIANSDLPQILRVLKGKAARYSDTLVPADYSNKDLGIGHVEFARQMEMAK